MPREGRAERRLTARGLESTSIGAAATWAGPCIACSSAPRARTRVADHLLGLAATDYPSQDPRDQRDPAKKEERKEAYQ
jgi:hypothetical protein